MTGDAELTAMLEITRLLDPLPVDAIERVLSWADDRWLGEAAMQRRKAEEDAKWDEAERQLRAEAEARAQAEAEAERERLLRYLALEQARVEQVIEAQVRNAMQAIRTARQRIAAAEASEAAAKEKLDSETRLYQSGESTNFFVLTRQNEYLDARRRAVLAQLDFNKAMARLEQAQGNTLAAHGVKIR